MNITEEEFKEMQRAVASALGKKSWESRKKGKSKKEIKEIMSKVAKSRKFDK